MLIKQGQLLPCNTAQRLYYSNSPSYVFKRTQYMFLKLLRQFIIFLEHLVTQKLIYYIYYSKKVALFFEIPNTLFKLFISPFLFLVSVLSYLLFSFSLLTFKLFCIDFSLLTCFKFHLLLILISCCLFYVFITLFLINT
jgi:hypothetical protein